MFFLLFILNYLTHAGFYVVVSGYLFFFLLPPILAVARSIKCVDLKNVQYVNACMCLKIWIDRVSCTSNAAMKKKK